MIRRGIVSFEEMILLPVWGLKAHICAALIRTVAGCIEGNTVIKKVRVPNLKMVALQTIGDVKDVMDWGGMLA